MFNFLIDIEYIENVIMQDTEKRNHRPWLSVCM